MNNKYKNISRMEVDLQGNLRLYKGKLFRSLVAVWASGQWTDVVLRPDKTVTVDLMVQP